MFGSAILMFFTMVGMVWSFWKSSHADWEKAIEYWKKSEEKFNQQLREDWKRCDDQILAIRELTNSINLEIRDFHNRLCAIEERRLKEK